MPRQFDRMVQIGDLIQQQLSLLIRKEVRTPGLGLITVSDVKVSKDLSHAKVYVSCLGTDEERKETLEILKQSAKLLRMKLAHSVRLRVVPELHFFYDESVETGDRIRRLLNDVNRPLE